MADEQGQTADPRQVKRARRRETRLRRQREQDLRGICSTVSGRRWLWTLLGDAGLFMTSFDRDALGMAFKEGQRSLGLRVLAELNDLNPELYHTMALEAAKNLELDTPTDDDKEETDS